VAHSGLGRAYLQKGELDLAIQELEKALKINERQIGVHYDLGIAYLRKGDKEKAAAAFNKVIDLDPQSPLAGEAKKQLAAIEK
jgi:Tfp pilus assembly protein PilF